MTTDELVPANVPEWVKDQWESLPPESQKEILQYAKAIAEAAAEAMAIQQAEPSRQLQQEMAVFDDQLDEDALLTLHNAYNSRDYVGEFDEKLPEILESNPLTETILWGDLHGDKGNEQLIAANADTLKQYGFAGLAVEFPMNCQGVFNDFNQGHDDMSDEELREQLNSWLKSSAEYYEGKPKGKKAMKKAAENPDVEFDSLPLMDEFRGYVFAIDAPVKDGGKLDMEMIREMFPDEDLSQYNEFTIRNMVMERNIRVIQATYGIKLNVLTGVFHNFLIEPVGEKEQGMLGEALPNALSISVLPAQGNFKEGQLYTGNGITEHYKLISKESEYLERWLNDVHLGFTKKQGIPIHAKAYQNAARSGEEALAEFIQDVNDGKGVVETIKGWLSDLSGKDKGGIKVDLPPIPKSLQKNTHDKSK